jgi:hypothetical protein
MTAKRRQYVLKHSTLAKLVRVGKDKCRRCGEQLKLGDEILAKPTTYCHQTAYHKKCAEQVNLI